MLVGGFGTIEADLDQPDNTNKLVTRGAVADVPGLSQHVLSTPKAVEQ